MRLRAPTEADAQAAADIVVAVDIAELGEPDYTVEDLRDEWNETGFDRDKDAVVVEDENGTRIAYAHFRGADLLAVTDPDREGEGAGTAILEWAERRARERGDTKLRQGIGSQGTSAQMLLERHGWARLRSYYRLERAVTTADEEPPGLRALKREDAPALDPIYVAAWRDRPDYTPRSQREWTRRHFDSHSLDLGLSRVADGRGFTLVRRHDADVAYVELLTVHPDHAGQGLGSALLRATFAAAARAGLARVTLSVASDNPNALRLYERVGMTERWRIDDYQKALPH